MGAVDEVVDEVVDVAEVVVMLKYVAARCLQEDAPIKKNKMPWKRREGWSQAVWIPNTVGA